MAARGVTMKYDRVHRVRGEGNFVFAVSEGSFAVEPTSFYGLFRVEGDAVRGPSPRFLQFIYGRIYVKEGGSTPRFQALD